MIFVVGGLCCLDFNDSYAICLFCCLVYSLCPVFDVGLLDVFS